jgi:hypothetical protein
VGILLIVFLIMNEFFFIQRTCECYAGRLVEWELVVSSSPTVEGRGGLTSHIRSPIWEMSGKNHLLDQARREEGSERGQGF